MSGKLHLLCFHIAYQVLCFLLFFFLSKKMIVIMPLQGSYQTRIYYFIIWKKISPFFPLSFDKIQELIKKFIANAWIFEYSIQHVNVFFFLDTKIPTLMANFFRIAFFKNIQNSFILDLKYLMIFYYSRHQACKYKIYAQMLWAPTQNSNILKLFYHIHSNKKIKPFQ